VGGWAPARRSKRQTSRRMGPPGRGLCTPRAFHPRCLSATAARARRTARSAGTSGRTARVWGLVPSWWSKPLKELKLATFNARAETVTEKPSYMSQLCDVTHILPSGMRSMVKVTLSEVASFPKTRSAEKCARREGGTSSAQTRNPDKVPGPKVWVRGTSAASRPCAMRTRPIDAVASWRDAAPCASRYRGPGPIGASDASRFRYRKACDASRLGYIVTVMRHSWKPEKTHILTNGTGRPLRLLWAGRRGRSR
jgi:hypothetical protein